MSLTHDDVTKILKIIDSMEGRDVHIEYGDLKIHVNRSGRPLSAPAPIPAAPSLAPTNAVTASDAPPAAAPIAPVPATTATPTQESPVPAGHVAVRAPMVGTFYRAPSPGATPFVEVGAKVTAQDTVCLLEVMKLFNSIKAGVNGKVTDIRAQNAALVQRDTVLIVIQPD